jgi:hypothetical protein
LRLACNKIHCKQLLSPSLMLQPSSSPPPPPPSSTRFPRQNTPTMHCCASTSHRPASCNDKVFRPMLLPRFGARDFPRRVRRRGQRARRRRRRAALATPRRCGCDGSGAAAPPACPRSEWAGMHWRRREQAGVVQHAARLVQRVRRHRERRSSSSRAPRVQTVLRAQARVRRHILFLVTPCCSRCKAWAPCSAHGASPVLPDLPTQRPTLARHAPQSCAFASARAALAHHRYRRWAAAAAGCAVRRSAAACACAQAAVRAGRIRRHLPAQSRAAHCVAISWGRTRMACLRRGSGCTGASASVCVRRSAGGGRRSHAHLSNMLIDGRAGVAKDLKRGFTLAAAGAAHLAAVTLGAMVLPNTKRAGKGERGGGQLLWAVRGWSVLLEWLWRRCAGLCRGCATLQPCSGTGACKRSSKLGPHV